MSVSDSQQSSRSASSGLMQGRFFSASSMYGGAGGLGTCISQSTYLGSSRSLTLYGKTNVVMDGKLTMKNLNERLSSYLETVRSLEAKKKELELNISEFCVKETVTRDLGGYFATISELREEIRRSNSENERLLVQIDNCKMAAGDFKMRFEMEYKMHDMVEADILRLRGNRDSLTITISNLEKSVEDLRGELVIMRNSHKEELHKLRIQREDVNLNVELDAADSTDLKKVLEDMREQYELLVKKNKLEIEKWYQLKMDALQTQIITCNTEVKTFYVQLTELRRTYQSLEINQQSIYAEIGWMQQNVTEVQSQYAVKLHQQQEVITVLEKQLQELRVSLTNVQGEYSVLLDIKSRLEMEIAEYRRLLEGDFCEEKKTVVITKVMEVVEEQKPHIEKRVKTIVEQIVDGKVVSSSVDTQVETVQ